MYSSTLFGFDIFGIQKRPLAISPLIGIFKKWKDEGISFAQ